MTGRVDGQDVAHAARDEVVHDGAAERAGGTEHPLDWPAAPR